MNATAPGGRDAAPLRAIATMVFAMAALALSDMFIKLATTRLPVGQVMLALSLGGSALFVAFAWGTGVRLADRRALILPPVLLRNGAEAVAAVGLVLGLAYTPLSLVAVIMQATPLLVTLGAATILREPVGWRRWGAVLAGLFGMLLVLRPGGAGFEASALFVVMGVCGLALRDVATRLVPSSVPSLALSTWGFVVTIPASCVMILLLNEAPSADPAGLGFTLGAILVTSAGYFAVTQAMRLAPAALVSPFRYTRLVFTMGIGILIFGDRPDAPTLIGAAIIIASGLYVFLRERRLARQAPFPPRPVGLGTPKPPNHEGQP